MIIDTNILIAYLNNEDTVVIPMKRWKQEQRALFISSISTAEVLALPSLSFSDVNTISLFLREFISIPFDDALAEHTAFFRRVYRLSIPDAAIAATAFYRGVPLITRDRQFKKVKEINVLEL